MEFVENSYINSILEDIKIDFDGNLIELCLYWPETKTEIMTLSGVLSLKYLPDFSDEPPWLCLDFTIDKIASLELLSQSDILWAKGSPVLSELKFPLFNVSLGSGDFYFHCVCQEVTVK